MKMLIASLALLSAAFVARAAEWDHYQVILDRHPFGALATGNTNVTPDFAKSLRLSAIWMARGQPRAGFEDSADKIKRDFVLTRGEVSEDGIELVDVQVADEAVTIRKGSESATMHIQAGISTNMPAVNVPGMPNTPGGPGNANPWREFYERYRQRHQQDGGAPGQPPQFQMPGGGGGAFSAGPGGALNVSGAGQAQPTIIYMQSGATDAGANQPGSRSRYNGQMNSGGGSSSDGSTGTSSGKHKHSHAPAMQ